VAFIAACRRDYEFLGMVVRGRELTQRRAGTKCDTVRPKSPAEQSSRKDAVVLLARRTVSRFRARGGRGQAADTPHTLECLYIAMISGGGLRTVPRVDHPINRLEVKYDASLVLKIALRTGRGIVKAGVEVINFDRPDCDRSRMVHRNIETSANR
jgi:hypothetical protein